ncbi:hypothetical protein BOTBODRAFT_45555 [Botryobasidium botryosum FD-172 SS1]|uniref:Peptidase M41 domain-containing protein n=1 Tax=Botryobasidium botryosum (strain FD-172 SS1) TaxID=930990 RepID=A0A067MAZ7_BOTB1|nr:hypothetical protein BOTBODRAFT_45555 [Botryobasidium botryosum FD-172 SS1]
MCMILGGRVAEKIFLGDITASAQDDLQKITHMAFEVCTNYGMNPVIGPVRYGGSQGQKEHFQKPFSEKTGEMLDSEVRKKDDHGRSQPDACTPHGETGRR